MTFDCIIKMTITPQYAENVNEGLSEAKLKANKIINEINNECDYPKMEIIDVSYRVNHLTSYDLQNVDEARELREIL